MSLLDQVKAAVQQVQGNEELNALRFRHEATWSDGTSCRFSVQDPTKGKDVRAAVTDPQVASLRVLRLHPDDTSPTVGAHIPWEGGTLHLGPRADISDFTGQASISCRIVDARYYPQTAASEEGSSVRLRIVARGALPFSVSAGLQDVQGAPVSSHVGFVEPGVKLHGGDVITLPSGDAFTVVPPLQHDLLGDTVGLSWQGEHSMSPVNPDPTPDPSGTSVVSPGDDSYWRS